MTAREPAWAKVNLYLHVTGRRADGYHLLDSLAVFPAIGDVVTATPSETLSLTLTGRFGAALTAEPDNLVLRAAHALAAQSAVTKGAALSLQKNLPVASGIGGGSSDAAAALRALCRLWQISPSQSDLRDIAATLGADVPVCLAQRPARMQGIGEILTPGPELPPCGMVLINPGQAVPTQAVFKARTGGFRPDATLPTTWRTTADMAEALRSLHNDLEPPAITICPAIADVLAALRSRPDCLLARMSGSGATCYGLFPTPSAAEAAATALIHDNWWVWGGAAQADGVVEQPGLPDHGRGP